MAAAVALSQRGRGHTTPNPNVGCIIVKQGIVVGRGWTQPGGRPHAEAMALAQAGESAVGATVYVTLEPCAHVSSRGPMCAQLLIDAGVARVVIAATDPDPRTNGQGSALLLAAGVKISTGVLAADARATMAGYFMQSQANRPFITLKLGMSLDGCIALHSGESQWITGEDARAHAHLERARNDMIVVGGGTMRSDAPRLTVRLPGLEDRSPQRALLTRGDAPPGWFKLASPSLVYQLADVHYLLIEGGAGAAAAFLREDLVDRLMLYRAPILVGVGTAALADIGLASLSAAHGRWQRSNLRSLGNDLLEVYERVRPATEQP